MILKELLFFIVTMGKEELEQLFVAFFYLQEPLNHQSKRCIFMQRKDLNMLKGMESPSQHK